MGNFKNVLRNLRTQRNLTQDALANRLGTSKSAISMYENGNREPDFETLEAIADFFNVDMDFLLGRSKYSTAIHAIAAHCENEHCTDEVWKTIVADTFSYIKDWHGEDCATMLQLFIDMNSIGREKALDYVKDLAKLYPISQNKF